MKFERSSGVVLHPTSLPGPYGIGDLGAQGYRWLDFLAEAGCRLWQVLPLGPTGYGDSPYQCFSAFAGNPYLISPEALREQGLLLEDDLAGRPEFPPDRVDYGTLIPWKLGLLDRAYDRFQSRDHAELRSDFHDFRQAHASWLDDFALFMALKEANGGRAWSAWPDELRLRSPRALEEARRVLGEAVERQRFRQFLFYHQWSALRAHAASRGIRVIGDVPIFVAYDSADVWAHPELFQLDARRRPAVVAGVPPDYFSPTGQLWGNPLYRWRAHAQNGYRWWLERLRAVLSLVDIVRLDHFRGFAGYWEVPAGAETAEKGRWVKGPGAGFFRAVKAELGDLPVIAEDLGEITPDVIALRDRFGLPGMKVLQFAFTGDPENEFLVHNYIENCVVYTGTHDNDTTRGWYERVGATERDFCRRYLNSDGRDIAWDMIRAAWLSVAVFALAPMQDILSLGNDARMNFPGRPGGNWTWRLPEGALRPSLGARIAEVNWLYGRADE